MAARENLRCPSRVLVTGAGGFIGRHLVRDQLNRGRAVVALDIQFDQLTHRESTNRLKIVEADIRNRERIREALDEIDTIFHLASAHLQVGKPDSFFHEVNVEAAANLVADADEAGVERFVHCSSVGVFGPLEGNLPANELSACKPDILYERTKLAGERKVLDEASRREIDLVSLRPAWVYGPGCPRTEKLFRTILDGKFAFIGNGENLRHPIFIQDMVQAFELASVSDGIDGEIIIVAGEKAVNLKELTSTIAAIGGVSSDFRSIPFSIMRPLAWAVEIGYRLVRREPPFSTRSLKFFSENSSFDISKARELFDFSPEISLEEGLSMTYAALEKGEDS